VPSSVSSSAASLQSQQQQPPPPPPLPLPSLQSRVAPPPQQVSSHAQELHGGQYSCVAADLRNMQQYQAALSRAGFDNRCGSGGGGGEGRGSHDQQVCLWGGEGRGSHDQCH
jgi:hypothetical protein